MAGEVGFVEREVRALRTAPQYGKLGPADYGPGLVAGAVVAFCHGRGRGGGESLWSAGNVPQAVGGRGGGSNPEARNYGKDSVI